VPKYVEKRLIIIIASIISFVGFTFVGPSLVFNMPDNLYLIGIGQAITGASTATMIIPGLSEMIDS
jgi:MFS family permease